MAVPAHDSRDREFATAFNLPIFQVVAPPKGAKLNADGAFSDPGKAINSSSEATGLKLDGLNSKEAAARVIEWLESTKQGSKKVNYRLRDWLFARQRYWGEPFPMIYVDGATDPVPIQESELPLVLPETDSYKPSGSGESPLANITEWVNTIGKGVGLHPSPFRR
jgi:leucyl-tRNA synthetase